MLQKMLTGLVLIAAFHSFAAFQYALEKVDGMESKPYGYSYSLNIKAGAGSIYLTDRISYDTSFSGKVNAGDAGNFGYIDLVTGERKNAEATAVTLEDGRVAYKLGDFKEGDRIGIWVKTTDGDLGGTVGGEDMGYSDNFNNRDINPSDLAIGKLHFKGSGALFFQVVGNEKKPPSGRPLPGVVATLLIGAAAVLAFHFLRRRKTA